MLDIVDVIDVDVVTIVVVNGAGTVVGVVVGADVLVEDVDGGTSFGSVGSEPAATSSPSL